MGHPVQGEDSATLLLMRVGIYARISEDSEGRGLGVARQEQDARTIAKLRGWEVGQVYVDNDVSAFNAKVIRHEFERMLEDLRLGAVDGCVVYDLDRFARQPADLERAIKIFDGRDGLAFATVQGDIDLSSPDGRTMARVMVAFANKSSMDTSRRAKRKHLELAQSGALVGSRRVFGYEDDRVTLKQSEVDLIREAATDIISGVWAPHDCPTLERSRRQDPLRQHLETENRASDDGVSTVAWIQGSPGGDSTGHRRQSGDGQATSDPRYGDVGGTSSHDPGSGPDR